MEVEANLPVVAKKLWNIVRILFFMLKTGISKSKIMVDLHFMLKKSKYNASKAISNLVFHHLSSLSCKSNDGDLSFISPREYEFSCSNSPAFYPFYVKRNKHLHHFHSNRRHNHFSKSSSKCGYDDVTTMAALQKVLEMLNNHEMAVDASPMVLPGFGRSPMVRQQRVTDSPFPLKDEGDNQVDMAAEEFISKFYKNLKSQKEISAF